MSRAPSTFASRAPSALPVPGVGVRLVRYLGTLTVSRTVLWLYLVWYLYAAARYFEPAPSLWLSSLGISAIIGTGLYLSTAHGGATRTRLEPWQIVRLYLMPFCVSSFAALIKGRGFVLIFHPTLADNARAAALCVAFVAVSRIAKLASRRGPGEVGDVREVGAPRGDGARPRTRDGTGSP